jgi:Cu/Zn superoxide dismutase
MRRTAILFVLPFLAAACGGSVTTTSSPAPAAAPSPKPLTVTLNAVGNSGVTGTAEITKETGSFTVKLTLSGMKASSQHANHIHKGACTKSGPIDKALQTISADASGSGTATTTVPAEFAIPAEGWYVNVHTGPDITQPGQGAPIACGDVPAS